MKHFLKQVLLSFSIFIAAHDALSQHALVGGDAKAGAAKAAVCGACHGSDGNSLTPNFPKLAGQGDRYILKQLRDIRAWDKETNATKKPTTGRAVLEMTGILVNLTDQDLADLAAYFSAQNAQLSGSKKLEVQVNSGIKVDAMELGAKLYRTGNPITGTPACTGCHSPDGKGNPAAGFPRLSGQHPDYVEKQLINFRSGARINDAEMTMRSIADKLSDAEIKAVANFVAGLN